MRRKRPCAEAGTLAEDERADHGATEVELAARQRGPAEDDAHDRVHLLHEADVVGVGRHGRGAVDDPGERGEHTREPTDPEECNDLAEGGCRVEEG